MKESYPLPKRIMIFGIPGSGKSFFAVWLGEQLDIPVEHLDRYFYVDNWVERDYDQFLHIQEELIKKERWIIDGNAIKSFEMRFKTADVVLYFRFNRLLCLWRIFKRLLDHRISDRADGCLENVRWRLVRYLWRFNERVRQSIQEMQAKYPHVLFYELRNQQDIRNFMQKYR